MGPFDMARSERDKEILRKPCFQLDCWSTAYEDSWSTAYEDSSRFSIWISLSPEIKKSRNLSSFYDLLNLRAFFVHFPSILLAIEEESHDGRLFAQNPINISSLSSFELEEFIKATLCTGRSSLYTHGIGNDRVVGYLISNSLEINLLLLFGSLDTDENCLSSIVKNAFCMYENAILLKDSEMNDSVSYNWTCAPNTTTWHNHASILHLIHKYDFVINPMADSCSTEKKYGDGSLASSLIRKIGRTNQKECVKDNVGAEHIGHFLVELADRLLKFIPTNIGIVVPHFGGESYKIRNALVGVEGKLVLICL